MPSCPGALAWIPADVNESLKLILEYVETEAGKAIAWYFDHKRWKAHFSRFIQFSAVALTALGAIFPILSFILKQTGRWPNPPDSGLWSALFVGLAAALIGTDRAFGLSSGWARYVLTATSIRKALEEFRMDWILLAAAAGSSPTPDQIAALVQKARDFRVAVEGFVLQETKEWAAEFQSNVAQMEKEVKTQLDALKAQVERANQAQAAASEPGSIELSVPNADKSDGFMFEVSLEGSRGPLSRDRVNNSKKWVRINTIPGQYKLSVSAIAAGKPVAASGGVMVKPQEQAKLELPLPL